MANHMNCPECEHPFGYSAALIGKTIRCRQCQHTFTVKAPATKPSDSAAPPPVPSANNDPNQSSSSKPTAPPLPAKVVDNKDEVRRSQKREQEKSRSAWDDADDGEEERPRTQRRRSRDDDDDRPRSRQNRYADRSNDDEDDREERSSPRNKRGSDSGMLIMMIVGCVFLVALIVGVVGYVMWPSKKANNDPYALNNPPPNVILNPAPLRPNPPPPPIPRIEDVLKNPPGVNPPPNVPNPPPARPIAAKPQGLEDRQEIALGAPADGTAVGGAGRWLCIAVPGARKVVVFDTANNKIAKEIPIDSAVKLAAGRDMLYILDPAAGTIIRWKLSTMERDGQHAPPWGRSAQAMAMGNNCDGPLVVSVIQPGNGRKTGQLVYVDGKTYVDLNYRVQGPSNAFGLGLFDKPVNIQASSDGKIVTAFAVGSLSGLQCDVVEGTNVTRTWQHLLADPLVPLADGSALGGKGCFYNTELKTNDKDDFFNPKWLVPATEGNHYMLISKPRERGGFGEQKQPLQVSLWRLGVNTPTLNVGDFPELTANDFGGPRSETLAGYVFYMPTQKLIAVIAPDNLTRLVTYRMAAK